MNEVVGKLSESKKESINEQLNFDALSLKFKLSEKMKRFVGHDNDHATLQQK